ncbi:translation machinery-associated protein 16 [Rhizina undulata]
MPIALAKVTKKIKAKKGGKLDALSGRDSKRVNRAALREEKLRKVGSLRAKTRETELVRVGYFKVCTKDAIEPFSVEKTQQLIAKWVHRDDEELAEFQSKRRPGRPATNKEDLLKMKIDKEIEEFRTGYYVPDLQDWANVERLKRWDGSVGGLAQITFTRITRDDLSSELKMEMEM